MSDEKGELQVKIAYKGVETEFRGQPKQVYGALVSYLEKIIPALSLASMITYSIDLQKILEEVKGVLAYIPGEEMIFLKPPSRMSASDSVMLFLLKRYLEHSLGLRDSPDGSISEMTETFPRPEKTISSRLSELIKQGYVRRVGRGNYTLTVTGLKEFTEKTLPKLSS